MTNAGWGTLIRTRTKRVRAARSTVKLSPTYSRTNTYLCSHVKGVKFPSISTTQAFFWFRKTPPIGYVFTFKHVYLNNLEQGHGPEQKKIRLHSPQQG